MDNEKQIAGLFNSFAGREVQMREIVHEWQDVDVRTEERKKTKPLPVRRCSEWELADKDAPIIREMEQLAKSKGLFLRLWWPGKPGQGG